MNRRRTYQRPESTEQLMSWRAPRLSQTAHAVLALAVATAVMVVGTLVAASLVASISGVLLFVVVWAFLVTSALYAYAEAVIRR